MSRVPLSWRRDPLESAGECLSKATHCTRVTPVTVRRSSGLDTKVTAFHVLLLLKSPEAVLNKKCVL